MNSICFRFRIARPPSQRRVVSLATAAGIFVLAFMPLALCLRAQVKNDSSAEFKRLAAELSTARLNGTVESEIPQEKALGILDELACSFLSSSALPDLDAANQRMASLVSHTPPVGENYRLVKLGGSPAVYALVVNFGLGGPAAVRIYAGTGGRYALAAKIDHFVQKDFFDSDIELVPVSATEPVFVTVAAARMICRQACFRPGDSMGIARCRSGVRICCSSQTMRPMEMDSISRTAPSPMRIIRRQCLKMTRDLYRWQAGEWKRIETDDLGPAKTPAK